MTNMYHLMTIQKINYLIVFFFITSFDVLASEDKAAEITNATTLNAEPINSGYLLQLVVGLFVVLLCILVLAWLAKKMNRFQSVADDSLKVIGGLSMGSRERVALLQVGEEQLLIGISATQINTLHVLKAPIKINDKQTNNEVGKSFLEKLNAVMAKSEILSEENKSKQ